MAFRRLNQGDSAGYQRWLRARVLAQGFTIVAIVAAGVQEFGPGVFKGKSTTVMTEPLHEKRAFQERMKEAEEAHRAETVAERGPSVESSAAVQRPSESQNVDLTANLGEARNSSRSAASSSWSSWFSWTGTSKK